MGVLNKPAYELGKGGLIYDAQHDIDAKNVTLTVAVEKETVLAAGQVLDFDATNGWTVHAKDGVPAAILAEEVVLATDDTDVTVTAYISGDFHADRVTANPELTAANVEALRSKGIYLK